MRKASSVIEINGNRYDALTGQLIGVAKKAVHHVTETRSGAIDGFVRGASGASNKTKIEQTSTPAKAEAPKQMKTRKTARSRLRHTAQTVHSRAQKSKTLMRSSVSRPKREVGEAPSKIISPPHSTSINPSRATRAKVISRNTQISRFGSAKQADTEISQQPVKTIKAETRTRSSAITAQVSPTSSANLESSGPSVMAGLTNNQLERLLDHALTRAGAQKNSLTAGSDKNFWQKIKVMPRWASIGASLSIVLVLALFFAWQNIPQVSMRLAASRAGVPASVPNYAPTGFSFSGPITYSNGAVSIRYSASGNSSRSYSIVQQKTNLDSQTLASSDLPVDSQVHEVNGTRVFIYGDGKDATWVNRGVRYTITDQAGLSSDQIMKIVGSL